MKTIDVELTDQEPEEETAQEIAEETSQGRPWGLLSIIGAFGLLTLFAVPGSNALQDGAEVLGITHLLEGLDGLQIVWGGILLVLGLYAIALLLKLVFALLSSPTFWVFVLVCFLSEPVPAIIAAIIYHLVFTKRD